MLVRHNAPDQKSIQIAQITGLNRNNAHRLLRALQVRISKANEEASPFRGEIGLDELYFGPKRVQRRSGPRAGWKTPCLASSARNSEVYTESVPACSHALLCMLIRWQVSPDCIIHLDSWWATTGSPTWDMSNIPGLIMARMSSLTTARTSTASRALGPTPRQT